MKPVIGIGAATWDHLYRVREFPCVEGVAEASASAFNGGGPVATALCAMAVNGIPCALLDVQGGDQLGSFIFDDLKKHGVSTEHMKVQPGTTSAHAVVMVREHDAARHITYFPSSAGPLPSELVPESLIAEASLLHINGRHEDAARRGVALARQHGVPVSFDGGAGRYRESIRDLVQTSQILILARDFAARFTGQDTLDAMAASLLSHQAQVVVITEGTRGSHVWSRAGEAFHQDACPASPLVDTTGCGDVYHGAFLALWLQGESLRVCADTASRVAAINAQGLGGRYALGRSG